MKILVMSEDEYSRIMERYKDLIRVNQPHRTAFAAVPAGLHDFRNTMTEIDIPDGCTLAVVDTTHSQSGWVQMVEEVEL